MICIEADHNSTRKNFIITLQWIPECVHDVLIYFAIKINKSWRLLAYTFRLAFFFVLVFVFMFSLEIIKTQDFEWKICWKNNCLYSYVFRNEDIWKMNGVAVNAPSDECCSAIKNWTPKHRIKLMSLAMILHLCRLQKLTKWVWLAGFCFQFQFGDCQYLEMNGNKLKKNENSEVFPMLGCGSFAEREEEVLTQIHTWIYEIA